MSELTLEQATAECRAHESDFQKVRFTACKFEGISAADTAACEASVTACESAAATPGNGVDCDSVDIADLEGCEVTVGEFSDCMDELASYLATLDCADDVGTEPEMPACWGSVGNRCPMFSQ